MPIISFSVNEHLKKFLNKLVSKKYYSNQSNVIREALLRFMSTMEISEIERESFTKEIQKQIIGNAIVIIENDDELVNKKISKLESDYGNSIVGKSQFLYSKYKTILFVFEGEADLFQNFVTDLNAIENLKNFRYVIIS
jgi:metal-responsive CopG/Arc/MetJ family transcriptional regulator